MIVDDPNVQRVEVVAHVQNELRDQAVLVGGNAATPLIDNHKKSIACASFIKSRNRE